MRQCHRFTTEDLDKNYRLNGPVDDRHQALAFVKVRFDDGGVFVTLEPDNSLRRDVWRLDRDDVEMIVRNRIMKTWDWAPKQVKFEWTDERQDDKSNRRGPEEIMHIRRAAIALVLERRLSHA